MASQAQAVAGFASFDGEARAHFEDRGYAVLRAFVDQAVLAKVRVEIDKLVDYLAKSLLSQGKISDLLIGEPFESRLASLYKSCIEDAPKAFRNELHLPGFYHLFFQPQLLDVIENILGLELRLYPNYTVRPKVPEWEGARVLWHQDGGYTASAGVATLRMVNVWTPLVPARVQNGCMQFIPGSHKSGAVPHERREHYLEISADFLQPRLGQAVDIELDPGDVVVFHNLLFHQGLPNHSSSVRWSLDWRYQDATQPTLRAFEGHLARSRVNPGAVVKSAEEWSSLVFK